MCGIVGLIEPPGRLVDLSALEAMNEAMPAPGPDDRGIFRDREAGIGMRRLSIIDVQGGRSPFITKSYVWTALTARSITIVNFGRI